jgi:dienelactone hydrolase
MAVLFSLIFRKRHLGLQVILSAALSLSLLSLNAHAAPPTLLSGQLVLEVSDISSTLPGLSYTYWENPDDTQEIPLSGYLLIPDGVGPFPAVIINHGKGGNAFGFIELKGLNWFIPAQYVVIAPTLTHAGKLACNVLSAQCGGSAENVRRNQLAYDILNSKQLIDALGQVVDRRKISIYGNSLGALSTIEFAQIIGRGVRAAAITAGGIIRRSDPEMNMTPSGVEGVKRIEAPFLQLHGRTDGVIYYSEAVLLSDTLESLDKEHQSVYFPDAGHGISAGKFTESVVKDFVVSWFQTHMDHMGPQIEAINPNQGSVGDIVTITGYNLGIDENQNSEVRFNRRPAEKILWEDNAIQLQVPRSRGAVSGRVSVVVPIGPIENTYITQPVIGGALSNPIPFHITR